MRPTASVATRAHEGAGAGQARARERMGERDHGDDRPQVFVRGMALDEAIGRESFPAMLLRLWRGDAATEAEAALLGACLVAAIDHGPLAPSALVARTIASTRATPMSALAGGILSFGELHGAVVTRAMEIVPRVPADGDLERLGRCRLRGRARRPDAGCRGSGIAGTSTTCGPSACSTSRPSSPDGRHAAAVRALAARVAAHVGPPVAVNIDGALAVALPRSGSTPSTATSCSRSRGASASRPTSSRSAPASGRCA